jgi:hypothetical protein
MFVFQSKAGYQTFEFLILLEFFFEINQILMKFDVMIQYFRLLAFF